MFFVILLTDSGSRKILLRTVNEVCAWLKTFIQGSKKEKSTKQNNCVTYSISVLLYNDTTKINLLGMITIKVIK